MEAENIKPVEWLVSAEPVSHPDAVAFMEKRVGEIRRGLSPETVWFLEHPALYTAGTSANADELLDPHGFPVYRTGRGGRYTYHGPGQRVAYVMLDLSRRGRDLRAYVRDLEGWLIASLGKLGVQAGRRKGRIGIWVDRGEREDKIAALGVRVRRWVTFHGVSLNVDVDLSHFGGIVPCGITEHGVTSLKDLGLDTGMDALDTALMESFAEVFGSPLMAPPRIFDPGHVVGS